MTSTTFAQLLQEYGGDEPVPNGAYDVEVLGAKVKMSNTTPPKHMIEARLRILNGPYANKTLTNNFVLTPTDSGPMFYWFRNFGALGLDHSFWQSLTGTIEESLPYIAQTIVGRQAHVEVESKNGRQNVEGWTPIAGGALSAAPMPQAPQPGYGMQMPGVQQPYPQVQQPAPGMPGMPAPPQPTVGPPGMVPPQQPGFPPQGPPGYPQAPQGPVAQPPPAPGQPAPWAQQPQAPQQGYPQPAQPEAVQAPQPMAAPPPLGATMPQTPAPQAPMGQPSPQGPAQMEQPLPAPPGFPQGAPAQGQVAPVTQLPGTADGQQQFPQQGFPQPGTPPPTVPV